jgi:hypothetical protein
MESIRSVMVVLLENSQTGARAPDAPRRERVGVGRCGFAGDRVADGTGLKRPAPDAVLPARWKTHQGREGGVLAEQSVNPTIWAPARSDMIKFRCDVPRWDAKLPPNVRGSGNLGSDVTKTGERSALDEEGTYGNK